jgi:hypothetical protein
MVDGLVDRIEGEGSPGNWGTAPGKLSLRAIRQARLGSAMDDREGASGKAV